MVVLSDGKRLTAADVPPEIASAAGGTQNAAGTPPAADPAPSAGGAGPAVRTGTTLADAEKEKILATLAEARYNKTLAAEMLGISRRTLHRKLNEWNAAK